MDEIRFTLGSVVYNMSRAQVIEAMKGQEPQPIQKLAVHVGNRWFPVKQVFGLSLGLDNSRFNSTRAYDLLKRLDFHVHSIEDNGPLQRQNGTGKQSNRPTLDRMNVLGLAVHLHAGQPGVAATTVVKTAMVFAAWVEGGVE